MADAPETDLALLLTACTNWVNDEILRRVRAEIGDDIRFHDGYVFQHLLAEPITGSQLAERLGVSQQAASKQIGDLERRGLVERLPHPDDARARRIVLTERGQAAVEAGRIARRAVTTSLRRRLGAGEVDALVSSLGAVAERTGAIQHLSERRTRPEQTR